MYVLHAICCSCLVMMVVAMFFDLPNKIFNRNDDDDDKDRKE